MRFLLALLIGKAVSFFCGVFRYGGTSLPGAMALKICPQLLDILATDYEQVVVVTGTNGKTTTANLITQLLRSAGISVASNEEGANMLSGVATALIKDHTIFNKSCSEAVVLEVDEGCVGRIFPSIEPKLVVVTNYFRDQLDRYCDLDHNITLLNNTLSELPRAELLLNGDDPLVVTIGGKSHAINYYGILGEDAQDELTHRDIKEGKFCPDCGASLAYHYYHYGQLGDYYCTKCTFKRPIPDFLAYDVKDDTLLHFAMSVSPGMGFHGGSLSRADDLQLSVPMQGFYNVYNALAAVAAALILGVSREVITDSLLEYVPATGRMKSFTHNGNSYTLALIKNPTGINEVLKTILKTDGQKALIIAINDLAADGRDVSWLWDAGLEMLNEESVKQVICSGRRAGDIAVRLKYAGLPESKIIVEPEPFQSIKLLTGAGTKGSFVLASYTNLDKYAGLLQGDKGRGVGYSAN